jgi:hypothetical protein
LDKLLRLPIQIFSFDWRQVQLLRVPQVLLLRVLLNCELADFRLRHFEKASFEPLYIIARFFDVPQVKVLLAE